MHYARRKAIQYNYALRFTTISLCQKRREITSFRYTALHTICVRNSCITREGKRQSTITRCVLPPFHCTKARREIVSLYILLSRHHAILSHLAKYSAQIRCVRNSYFFIVQRARRKHSHILCVIVVPRGSYDALENKTRSK